jgi:hypothetical protein
MGVPVREALNVGAFTAGQRRFLETTGDLRRWGALLNNGHTRKRNGDIGPFRLAPVKCLPKRW